jgi:hypothetical protein
VKPFTVDGLTHLPSFIEMGDVVRWHASIMSEIFYTRVVLRFTETNDNFCHEGRFYKVGAFAAERSALIAP